MTSDLENLQSFPDYVMHPLNLTCTWSFITVIDLMTAFIV
jgi:hypothetical protein